MSQEPSKNQGKAQETSPFSYVVFAGGGSRCLWQAGFWSIVGPELQIAPKKVAAVSAGGLIASLIFSKRADEALEYFKEATAKNEKNFYPENVFKKEAVFPQAKMYRQLVMDIFTQDALNELQVGPEIHVLLARVPWWLGARSGALLGFLLYTFEKKTTKPIHPKINRALGYKSETLSLRSCQTPEQLADALMQSSCTPPFTPLYYRDKKPVLDGGLVDNVPVEALGEDLDTGKTLVLLTRKYPKLNLLPHPSRLYVQPSKPVPISTWNYASPTLLQETYEQGKADGVSFLESFQKEKQR